MAIGQAGSNFYVRYRGRVTGPFALADLSGQVRRGALSRAHELSTDQANWAPADRLPGLFAPMLLHGSRSMPAPLATESAPSEGRIYYQQEGQTLGPVAVAALEVLVGSGQVGPQTLLWTDGDAHSYPASEHPLLSHLQWPDGVAADGRIAAAPARSGCGTLLIIGALLALGGGVALSIWMSGVSTSAHKDAPSGNVTQPPGAGDLRGAGSSAAPAAPAPK